VIREWAPALEKALRAVENIQVLNVHLQENEGGLFLQVPLMFEGFTGKADILIRREGKGHGTDSRDGVFRALFALDMDALGDVMAQARFSGKAVACRIDCASGAAASFVAGLLPDLERRLAAAGYRARGPHGQPGPGKNAGAHPGGAARGRAGAERLCVGKDEGERLKEREENES